MDLTTRLLTMGAAGAGAGGEVLGVEDVFSTWLYTGNGSTQTITNGIDLSGKGGLVWTKSRTGAFNTSHCWIDTTRGSSVFLRSDSTGGNVSDSTQINSFSSSGYVLGDNSGSKLTNNSGFTYASWTFRKAAKFFDVVTYTGTGSARTVAHNLGSVPGTIIVKRTDSTDDWLVYHRSVGATKGLYLNDTSAEITASTFFNNTEPTSTVFTVGTNTKGNASGGTYVAYLFAHDAGGFGDSGNDSVVKCGSFTADGSGNATVSLGWEPQWVLFKRSDNSLGGSWFLVDSMRGMPVGGDARRFLAESSAAEANFGSFYPTATGFASTAGNLQAYGTYIYIAIRRGPMKTPTDATKVFAANTYAGGTAGRSFSLGFVPDALLTMRRNTSNYDILQSRLTGRGYMFTNDTGAEAAALTGIPAWDADTETIELTTATSVTGWNGSGSDYVNQVFRRAPGFFDVVAYTGTGSATTVSHNLGVVPELMIVKRRDSTTSWQVYSSGTGATHVLTLNTSNQALPNSDPWNNTAPTDSVLTVGVSSGTNASGGTYIAYLFATLPGISKVGSYTGTGTTLNIDCGFTAGSRFVMIKRTDSTGDWYVFDTARGITSSASPYLLLNSTAAEVTGIDYIDPLSSGFQITSTAPAAINASGGSFIFLAVA